MEKYLVVISKAENNFAAYSPDVLGCVSTGKSVEETIKNMKEALSFHFEGLLEDGDDIPHPRGLAFYIQENMPIAEPQDLLTHVEIDVLQVV